MRQWLLSAFKSARKFTSHFMDATPLRPKIIILAGTTASKKSDFAVELAKTLGGEIISADSAQVFRGLDIGSNKVSKEVRAEIPHHLIDECNPTEDFSAAKWSERAWVITSVRKCYEAC